MTVCLLFLVQRYDEYLGYAQAISLNWNRFFPNLQGISPVLKNAFNLNEEIITHYGHDDGHCRDDGAECSTPL